VQAETAREHVAVWDHTVMLVLVNTLKKQFLLVQLTHFSLYVLPVQVAVLSNVAAVADSQVLFFAVL